MLKLKNSVTRETADVELSKVTSTFDSPPRLGLRFKRSTSPEWITVEEHALGGRRGFARVRPGPPVESYTALSKLLLKETQLTWLSIHRAIADSHYDNRERLETMVDKKANEIAGNFITFLSSLETKAKEKSYLFRDFIILSLLSDESRGAAQLLNSSTANLKGRADTLSRIFKNEFKMKEDQFSDKIKLHYNIVNDAVSRLNRKDVQSSTFTQNHFLALADEFRIQDVINQWEKINAELKSIYKPKDNFLTIMNGLLINKEFYIDERNRPLVKTAESAELSPVSLSSGEKQLFILLGETLLQEERQCIFIADEPELSLHVEWQNRLVNSIKTLNANAQLIFATHSPDIVANYTKRVINIEECIK